MSLVSHMPQRGRSSVNVCPGWLSTAPGLRGNCTGEISGMKFHSPLQTRSVTHSNFSTHTTNLFLPYTCACTFLYMTSLRGPKCCLRSYIFVVKRATHTFTSCDDIFKSHTVKTAVRHSLTKQFQMMIQASLSNWSQVMVWWGCQWTWGWGPNGLFGQTDFWANPI